MCRLTVIALGALGCVGAAPAAAQSGGSCLETDPPPVTKPYQPLRFGITPGFAGSAGTEQEQPRPRNVRSEVRALQSLQPPERQLILRLNRLFWRDGQAAIDRFAAEVDRYARAGLLSEIQVRYQPPEGRAGDIDAWAGFVRAAVRQLGRRPSVVGFSITNEANFAASPNTSDGAHPGVIDALVRGVAVAREELDRLGRRGVDLGFNVMWRSSPEQDEAFWNELNAKATPAFRRALTYVGAQVYPHLVWPPAPRPGVSAGEELVEALTLIRRCYMPKARLGDDVQLWVSENGYPTNNGRDPGDQSEALDSMVRYTYGYSGELGITDYRWFNLRDNRSNGNDLFSAVGLLYDDYRRKPSYAQMRGLIGLLGRRVPAGEDGSSRPGSDTTRVVRGARVSSRVTARTTVRRLRRGARRFTTTGRVLPPASVGRVAGCRGTVTVRVKAGRNTISTRRGRVRTNCSYVSRVVFRAPRRFGNRRALRVRVTFNGNDSLRASRSTFRSVRIR